MLCPLSSNSEIKDMLIENKIYNEILDVIQKLKDVKF